MQTLPKFQKMDKKRRKLASKLIVSLKWNRGEEGASMHAETQNIEEIVRYSEHVNEENPLIYFHFREFIESHLVENR